MATLNEVKEQIIVVKSVGGFTNALQQIATMRMMKLRSKVLKSRPFVELANDMLSELIALRNQMDASMLMKSSKKHQPAATAPNNGRRAVIVITSNQGLSGSYNTEIYKRVEKLMDVEKNSDFYIIGKKGQEYFGGGRMKVTNFPYEVVDNFTIEDLKRLIAVFDYYGQLTLVYSRFINTATRDVVATSIVNPMVEPADPKEHHLEQPVKYTFEPNITKLIEGISKKLRAALFQQQIFDARLSQFAAQMIGMQAASDNANKLLVDLQLEYNKARRKMIDKKISEVFAGSATWQG
jgi:F-type H+-transporting ATPase subunit gamma